MRITVFTSNQPRHVALIEALAGIAEVVYAIQECNTVFPGRVADFFRKSEVMKRYFQRVMKAEEEVFGRPRFAPANVSQMPLKMGDLNLLELAALRPALESDVYVVFGASYIKGTLCDHLVEHGAYNIHMGTSPYYRGSSTNFWALYDRRPDHVGATIHRLTHGLDSGPMLFHAFPLTEAVDPFVLGMQAVKSAHTALVERIRTGEIERFEPVPQDKSLEIRYTRNSDFTDAVASEYLDRLPSPEQVFASLQQRDMGKFLRPFVGWCETGCVHSAR
jgi:folate-dependent phosphoribosylglycinamide formyltransferase PurN